MLSMSQASEYLTIGNPISAQSGSRWMSTGMARNVLDLITVLQLEVPPANVAYCYPVNGAGIGFVNTLDLHGSASSAELLRLYRLFKGARRNLLRRHQGTLQQCPLRQFSDGLAITDEEDGSAIFDRHILLLLWLIRTCCCCYTSRFP